MKYDALRGQTSNIIFVFVPDSASTVGAGKTGLTNASAGLKIAVRRELSSAVTAYSAANLLSVTTLGTYSAPGSGKARFAEVDATNMPGVYEVHLEDSLFGSSDASRKLVGMVQVTGGAPSPFEIQLTAVDMQNATTGGLTNLDATVSGVPTAVWVAATRTLTAQSDSSGVTTLLARLTSTRAGLLDNLDGAVSGVAAAAATAVWAAAARTLTAQSDSSGVTTLLARLTSTRAGLLDNLDAAVSGVAAAASTAVWAAGSRTLTAQSDPSGVTTLLARLTSTRAGLLDNLDTAVSGVAAATTTAVWAAGSRTLTAANSTETGIKTVTDKLATMLENGAVGGSYRYTADALFESPAGSGGGGGLTSDQQAQLDDIQAHTGLIAPDTAINIASALDGDRITILRGDTLSILFTGLGSLAGRTGLHFSVKAEPDADADTDAILHVSESGGLLRLNGAAATSGQATLVVTDATAGNVTLTVAAAATSALGTADRLFYDVQLVASSVRTLTTGRARIDTSSDVTRATT